MEPFCPNDLVNIKGRRYCASCKVMALGSQPPVFESVTEVCKEANEALKYAIIGLFCFGIILEPIAISKALKAKKMMAANPNLTGSGRATVALIIAIIGLALWVIGLLSRMGAISGA
jgi:hypothetical protein